MVTTFTHNLWKSHVLKSFCRENKRSEVLMLTGAELSSPELWCEEGGTPRSYKKPVCGLSRQSWWPRIVLLTRNGPEWNNSKWGCWGDPDSSSSSAGESLTYPTHSGKSSQSARLQVTLHLLSTAGMHSCMHLFVCLYVYCRCLLTTNGFHPPVEGHFRLLILRLALKSVMLRKQTE